MPGWPNVLLPGIEAGFLTTSTTIGIKWLIFSLTIAATICTLGGMLLLAIKTRQAHQQLNQACAFIEASASALNFAQHFSVLDTRLRSLPLIKEPWIRFCETISKVGEVTADNLRIRSHASIGTYFRREIVIRNWTSCETLPGNMLGMAVLVSAMSFSVALTSGVIGTRSQIAENSQIHQGDSVETYYLPAGLVILKQIAPIGQASIVLVGSSITIWILGLINTALCRVRIDRSISAFSNAVSKRIVRDESFALQSIETEEAQRREINALGELAQAIVAHDVKMQPQYEVLAALCHEVLTAIKMTPLFRFDNDQAVADLVQVLNTELTKPLLAALERIETHTCPEMNVFGSTEHAASIAPDYELTGHPGTKVTEQGVHAENGKIGSSLIAEIQRLRNELNNLKNHLSAQTFQTDHSEKQFRNFQLAAQEPTVFPAKTNTEICFDPQSFENRIRTEFATLRLAVEAIGTKSDAVRNQVTQSIEENLERGLRKRGDDVSGTLASVVSQIQQANTAVAQSVAELKHEILDQQKSVTEAIHSRTRDFENYINTAVGGWPGRLEPEHLMSVFTACVAPSTDQIAAKLDNIGKEFANRLDDSTLRILTQQNEQMISTARAVNTFTELGRIKLEDQIDKFISVSAADFKAHRALVEKNMKLAGGEYLAVVSRELEKITAAASKIGTSALTDEKVEALRSRLDQSNAIMTQAVQELKSLSARVNGVAEWPLTIGDREKNVAPRDNCRNPDNESCPQLGSGLTLDFQTPSHGAAMPGYVIDDKTDLLSSVLKGMSTELRRAYAQLVSSERKEPSLSPSTGNAIEGEFRLQFDSDAGNRIDP